MLRELTWHRLTCVEGYADDYVQVGSPAVDDETSARSQNDPWTESAGAISWATHEVDARETGDSVQPGPGAAHILRGSTWYP